MPTINRGKRATARREKNDVNRKQRMKVYNSKKWKELRTSKIMQNPLCEVCEMLGRITLASDEHHLMTFTKFEGNERNAVAYDYDNLISLCKQHHYLIHHGYLYGCTTKEEIEERINAHLADGEKAEDL